jgi:Zn-finger nucleic acid-binding protein
MAGATYRCPSCKTALSQARLRSGSSWACRNCGGVAVGLAVVRAHAHERLSARLWRLAQASREVSVRKCPSCSKALRTFEVEDDSVSVELDACSTCMMLWFDSAELASIGVSFPSAADSEHGRELAVAHTQLMREQAEEAERAETLGQFSQFLLSVFGRHPFS